MSRRINEDVDYMRYLMGYQKGKVISEQKSNKYRTTYITEQSTTPPASTTTQTTQAAPKIGYEELLNGLKQKYTDKNGTLYTGDDSGYLEKIYWVGTTKDGRETYSVDRMEGGPQGIRLQYYLFNPGDKMGENPITVTQYCSGDKKLKDTIGSRVPSYKEEGKTTIDYMYRQDAWWKHLMRSDLGVGYDMEARKTEAAKQADLANQTEKNILEDGCKLIEQVQTNANLEDTLEFLINPSYTPETATEESKELEGVATPGNNFLNPIVTITSRKDGESTFWDCEVFGYFPTSKAASETGKVFIKAIKDQVFKDPELGKKENTDKVFVTFASVRGGASNEWGGPIGGEVTFNGEDYRNIVTLPGPYTGGTRFTKDKNLALRRANNFLLDIQTNFPTTIGGKAIKVAKTIKTESSGYVVETGGVTDTNATRDWSKYPIPGQHVYCLLTIEIRPQLEPDKEKSSPCLWKSQVSFIYESGRGHNCDTAVFDVWANDVYIGSLDLGNSQARVSGVLKSSTVAATGAVAKGSYATVTGGTVSGTLTISTEELAQKIVDASVAGEIKIKAKGKDESFYVKQGLDCAAGCSTHSEIPYMKVTNNLGQVVYDALPTTAKTVTRCGAGKGKSYNDACPLWELGEFNPCGKTAAEGTLSKALKS